jgi:hypothetical protein
VRASETTFRQTPKNARPTWALASGRSRRAEQPRATRHENSGAAAAHQQLLSGRRISPQAGVWLLRALACQRYALGVLVLQHEGPFSCCMLLRPAPTVAWQAGAGSLTRCFATPDPRATDLAEPILAACMQGCSPPPRLSVRVAPRCASACARSSPVCRCPVSLSVYRQRWHTVQA